MFEAQYYILKNENLVQCNLCPRICVISPGDFGNCNARKNRDGKLFSEVYGEISAINLDPVEKKPLYHFYPGEKILSVGTSGCNLHCLFCQNHTLSQNPSPENGHLHSFTPELLVETALQTKHNIGIAFTYNEPSINFEFMLTTALLAKQNGLATAMISNGYINPKPLEELLGCVDAFNIDIKSFDTRFYRKYCDGKLLPVLKTASQVIGSGCHLEITNLVIPGLNDNKQVFESLCRWIAEDLGKSTVLHISRYFPGYQLKLEPTPAETMFRMYDIAKNYLQHVYLGNMTVGDHGDTFCPHCNHKLIERNYFQIRKTGIDEGGTCSMCGTHVIQMLNYGSVRS